jgi:hypothetical protein
LLDAAERDDLGASALLADVGARTVLVVETVADEEVDR